jgi:hypothetical protein
MFWSSPTIPKSIMPGNQFFTTKPDSTRTIIADFTGVNELKFSAIVNNDSSTNI